MTPSLSVQHLRRLLTPAAACSVVLWAAISCSSDDNRTSSKQVIGPEGGQMSIGVASLSVPEDALARPTELEIRSQKGLGDLAAPPAGAESRSNVLTLLPHGLKFSKDVNIELEYDTPKSGVGSLVVGTLANDEDETWEPVSDASFDDGVAQFSVDSFSHYAVFEVEGGEWPVDAGGNGTGGAPAGTGGMTGTGGTATGGAGMATGGTTGGLGGLGGVGTFVPEFVELAEPTTAVTLGNYSTSHFQGYIEAFTTGGAFITAVTTSPELPVCVRADLAAETMAELNMELTLNETSQGEPDLYSLGSNGFEFNVSAPGYSGNLGVGVLDSDLLSYELMAPANAGPYSPSYAQFSYMSEGTLGVGISVVSITFSLFEGPSNLVDQVLCVESLGEY